MDSIAWFTNENGEQCETETVRNRWITILAGTPSDQNKTAKHDRNTIHANRR